MNKKIKELWDNSIEEFSKQHQYATIMLPEALREKFAELLFNEVANTTVVSDGMFNGNERRLSVELRLGDMVKKISVFGVEE
jgi:hypothetical protein